MEDLHKIGGTPAVMKMLLERDLLHGDCMTVTGRTLAENLEHLPGLTDGQEIVRTPDDPISARGHLRILYGNLAEQGSVAKITGKEGEFLRGTGPRFRQRGRCQYPRSATAKVRKGDVVVIRYEGPPGRAGDA